MSRTPLPSPAESGVLEIRELRHDLILPDGKTLHLLRDVNLHVAQGESVAVVGRSGSGKTTLLSLMGLMSNPTAGTIAVAGTNTTALSDRQRAGLRSEKLGFVFQGYSLVAHLNAEQNVALPCQYGAVLSRRDVRKRVAALLQSVGLEGMGRRYPRHLSGGEQQRVAIARALVRRPRVVLADEPTGALDVDTGEHVLTMLRTATRHHDCGLVVVTHDPSVVATMDRTVSLVAGRLQPQVGADA
jgi:ABC-type lipoprotein export system ATPase subunit